MRARANTDSSRSGARTSPREVVPEMRRGTLSLPEKQHCQKRLLLLVVAGLKPCNRLSSLGDCKLCFDVRKTEGWVVIGHVSLPLHADRNPREICHPAKTIARDNRHVW